MRPDFLLSRWVFLRLLGFVYLIAFTSLWMQIDGLVGSQGILPAADYLDASYQQLGSECYWRLPTLCWFNCSDTMLIILCALSDIVALLLLLGVAPLPALMLLWATYLSLSVAGQTFFNFQWDTLLLEVGFFAIFLAPHTILPRLSHERAPNRMARWLLWWLLFKLMFLSGVTKLLSGDPTWRDLTAMNVHYQTQPIPNWVSWYVHQLPAWFQQTTVVMTLAIELVVPFLIFAPRHFRHAACALFVLIQIIIQLTGNFGFFNLLTAALCILLLDDHLLQRLAPRRWTELSQGQATSKTAKDWKRIAVRGPLIILFFISVLTFFREMVRTRNPDKLPSTVVTVLDACDRYVLGWTEPMVLDWIAPFRTINGYGLFRVMTTERPEIIIEGSHDAQTWTEYEFKWKPGDIHRRPRFVAPHQPRLDWQMWFAALNPPSSQYWLSSLLQGLLEGRPEIIALFGQNPFRGKPPRYVRLVYYRYEFTDMETEGDGDKWWRRTRLGALTREVSLPSS